ncbi:MAG: universal stress protein [Dehalococcoidales bacterium]|nr:universal stress protein [Dehalococcoidales bacterium]
MYKKVVVPLDGSRLAETALPHLEKIAVGCNIPEVMLVSVTEKVKGTMPRSQAFEDPSGKAYDTPRTRLEAVQTGLLISRNFVGVQEVPVTLGKMAKTAFNYLCKIAAKLEKKGFSINISVLVGNPAEEIVKFVEAQKADLIIMASRGKSGFSRWEMGNIAEKVMRATRASVMLVKPGTDFKETRPKRKGKST